MPWFSFETLGERLGLTCKDDERGHRADSTTPRRPSPLIETKPGLRAARGAGPDDGDPRLRLRRDRLSLVESRPHHLQYRARWSALGSRNERPERGVQCEVRHRRHLGGADRAGTGYLGIRGQHQSRSRGGQPLQPQRPGQLPSPIHDSATSGSVGIRSPTTPPRSPRRSSLLPTVPRPRATWRSTPR